MLVTFFFLSLEAERAGRGRGKVGERSGSDLGAYFAFVFNVHDLVEFSRVHCCSVIFMQKGSLFCVVRAHALFYCFQHFHMILHQYAYFHKFDAQP